MRRFVIVFGFASALFIASCSHPDSKSTEAREPAAVEFSPQETHLEPDEIQPLMAAADRQDSQRLHELFSGLRVSQILVSSFDARLQQISKSEEADQLMRSNLYCRLMEVRPLQERIEDKIRIFYAVAIKQGAVGKDWFFNQLRTFAKQEPLSEIAAIQVIRLLQEDEVSYCGAKDCLSTDIQQWPEFHVPPLDDEALAAYSKKHSIALYKKVTKEDLRPGDCFGEQREPNQASSYDWAKRNWTGSTLSQGQFVFTYDDGPHPTFTRQIRDTWAQAGMPKPAFFWLSKNVKGLPAIVTEVFSQGHAIGSHSVDHKDLGALAKAGNTAALDFEIKSAVATLSKTLGKPVHYFRLPYGSGTKNPLIGARFQALNLEHFFWRVDSLDWQDKNPASIRDRVVMQMKATGRGIVLFHDIHPQSAKAAQLIVNYLKAHPEYKATSILDIPGLPKF